jgi:hypothetical protein
MLAVAKYVHKKNKHSIAITEKGVSWFVRFLILNNHKEADWMKDMQVLANQI